MFAEAVVQTAGQEWFSATAFVAAVGLFTAIVRWFMGHIRWMEEQHREDKRLLNERIAHLEAEAEKREKSKLHDFATVMARTLGMNPGKAKKNAEGPS